ncbi:MAG: hypothetical protein ABWY58_01565 [Aeromicrobium sp.]
MEATAVVLAIIGVAAAIAHIAAFAVVRPRLDDADDKAELGSWVAIGGGLCVSLVGYWVARGVFQSSWWFADGMLPLAILFGAASWGYISIAGWIEARTSASIPGIIPMVASAALGLAAGAAGLT